MPRVLVINGPNLNLLGTREPEVYGRATLEDINAALQAQAEQLGLQIEFMQSNHEGDIVDAIQNARGRVDAVIINPGGFTHTSIAIRDAFLAANLPFVECHLSNVFARESFRRHSYLTDIAKGIISGFGADSYKLALAAVAAMLAA